MAANFILFELQNNKKKYVACSQISLIRFDHNDVELKDGTFLSYSNDKESFQKKISKRKDFFIIDEERKVDMSHDGCCALRYDQIVALRKVEKGVLVEFIPNTYGTWCLIEYHIPDFMEETLKNAYKSAVRQGACVHPTCFQSLGTPV